MTCHYSGVFEFLQLLLNGQFPLCVCVVVLVVFELHPIGFLMFLDNSEIRFCPPFLVTVLAVPGPLINILCISAFKSLMSLAPVDLHSIPPAVLL